MSTTEDTECAQDVKVSHVITERLYYCFLVFDNKLIEKKNIIFVFMVANFNCPGDVWLTEQILHLPSNLKHNVLRNERVAACFHEH